MITFFVLVGAGKDRRGRLVEWVEEASFVFGFIFLLDMPDNELKVTADFELWKLRVQVQGLVRTGWPRIRLRC